MGTLLSNDLVWELTDFFNYLMVIPNVIALVALTGMVVKSSKGQDTEYENVSVNDKKEAVK